MPAWTKKLAYVGAETRIEDPPPGELEVLCADRLAVAVLAVRTQMEGVGLAVGREVEAGGGSRLGRQVRTEPHQRLEHLAHDGGVDVEVATLRIDLVGLALEDVDRDHLRSLRRWRRRRRRCRLCIDRACQGGEQQPEGSQDGEQTSHGNQAAGLCDLPGQTSTKDLAVHAHRVGGHASVGVALADARAAAPPELTAARRIGAQRR